MDKIEGRWSEVLRSELELPYMKELLQTLSGATFFPRTDQVFAAFRMTPFDDVKIIILGQDPYHGPDQAHGLSFSVPDGIAIPPSLKNIFKEIKTDLGITPSSSGNLARWATQGVLLLNSILTVAPGRAASHRGRGWERFTDAALQALSTHRSGLVFLLWGNYAINNAKLIDESKHLILKSAHPSPLSAHNGFFGCKHFSQANDYLKRHNQAVVDWK